MGIRVHELAKELKISVTALKTHLKHLNVEIKHHMTQLEDEVADKIRGIFKQESDNIKRIENDRKRYQEIKRQARRKEQEEEEEKRLAREKETKNRLEEAKKRTPQFIEKTIVKQKPAEQEKKHEAPKATEAVKSEKPITKTEPVETKPIYKERPAKPIEREREERPVRKPFEEQRKPYHRPQPKPPVVPEIKPVAAQTPDPNKKVVQDKKDVKSPIDDKPKHIQAKLKHGKKGKKKTKLVPTELEEAEISRTIKQTMTKMKKKKYRKDEKDDTFDSDENMKLVINEYTSANELSKLMDVTPAEIITKFFAMGKKVTINQRLDRDSLEMICDEFSFDVAFAEEYGTDIIVEAQEKHKDVEEEPRAPIVTIMGHVDHGKTSILDYIRSTNVIAGEAGGITQHIGAYQVDFKGHKITFLDTPGHEAFTAMRARGAHITDIAVIVVAANDSVKPQTIEAIDHARASGVELIVAINKIDLKTANLDRAISDLAKHNVYLENYGGSVLWAPCSALTGEGIDTLLENIILSAEMKELKAKYKVPGSGYVIEAQKDSRIGSMVTLLIKEGTLKKGDTVVCGATYGKIRKIENERGQEIKILKPSDVGVIFGLNTVPKAGDVINKVDNDRIARQISSEREQIRHEREKYIGRTNLDNLFTKIKEKAMNELKLIIKADVDGSLEAFCDSLQKLSNDEVVVNIIHRSVGSIIEADVNLAAASDAVIIGFQVRTETKAKKLAEEQGVDIRIYQIIYDGINDIKAALEGMIEPELVEKFNGSAIVKEVFRIKGVGTIAGCAVDKGFIKKESILRLYRNKGLVIESKVSSLKHFAEDVDEIRAGTECGIGIRNFNDIKEGDIIEAYQQEEVRRTL